MQVAWNISPIKFSKTKPSCQMNCKLVDTYPSWNINPISLSRSKPSCQMSYRLVNTLSSPSVNPINLSRSNPSCQNELQTCTYFFKFKQDVILAFVHWLYCQPKCQLSSSFSKQNVGQWISNYKCCLRNHLKGPWVAIMW